MEVGFPNEGRETPPPPYQAAPPDASSSLNPQMDVDTAIMGNNSRDAQQALIIIHSEGLLALSQAKAIDPIAYANAAKDLGYSADDVKNEPYRAAVLRLRQKNDSYNSLDALFDVAKMARLRVRVAKHTLSNHWMGQKNANEMVESHMEKLKFDSKPLAFTALKQSDLTSAIENAEKVHKSFEPINTNDITEPPEETVRKNLTTQFGELNLPVFWRSNYSEYAHPKFNELETSLTKELTPSSMGLGKRIPNSKQLAKSQVTAHAFVERNLEALSQAYDEFVMFENDNRRPTVA
jgi:hypothetical protein